jgi:hypothetical protein
MRRKLSHSTFRNVLTLIALPLALSGTGYALFSQELSIGGTVVKPAYSRSQNLSITYTRDVTPSGGLTAYAITVTIKNNGIKGITAWQSDFSLPSDFSALSCTNAACSQAGTTNTALNTGGNGTIAAGGSVVYVLNFSSANPNYVFTAIAISGTPAIVYQTLSGFTVAVNAGARTGNILTGYLYPVSYTITNNSGKRVLNWRMAVPKNSNDTVGSMDATVNFVDNGNQVTIFSKQAMDTGTTFQFRNRSFNSATIEGDI